MNSNDLTDEKFSKLLNDAYNCKITDSNPLLIRIESELEKNKDNKTILRAKRVLTSRMASKGIII